MIMQWVFTFDEGNRDDFYLLGGKGAGLCEMTKHNLPVPPGFIISTEACKFYLKEHRFPDTLLNQVSQAIANITSKTGNRFGDIDNPLIVSVRSGAPQSMPGMLETILNIGLTTKFVEKKGISSPSASFFYDSYIRLIRMFGRIVRQGFTGIDYTVEKPSFQDVISALSSFSDCFGDEFPQDPNEQLQQAIKAVFDSWLGQKAVEYRNLYQISDDIGTAVVVQMMVFGNKDDNSGTGVAFTRDPATGENKMYGEYLLHTQGEDIVSGGRTPQNLITIEKNMPDIYHQLINIGKNLEDIYKDAQDIEFTIESHKLWLLQTRSAKRTPLAAIKIAVDMAEEGLISKETAILRVEANNFNQLLSPRFQESNPLEAIANGIASSPGSASGFIALNKEKVAEFTSLNKPVIFVSENTSPDDVPIMAKVNGILTQHGGATSHAAVVARGLGKPCVVGCEALKVDNINNEIHINSNVISQGEYLSIDGNSGLVFAGKKTVVCIDPEKNQELAKLLHWADNINKIRIYLNSNTPLEVTRAVQNGIETIGLCKTEWMFNDAPFRSLFRKALLSDSELIKKESLEALYNLQTEQYYNLFLAAQGHSITIRLLSAPMDDFLPVKDALLTELSELRMSAIWNENIGQKEQIIKEVALLQQVNPRFGLHGSYLWFSMPEIIEKQIAAIFKGAIKASTKGIKVLVRFLLPDIIDEKQVSQFVEIIRKIAKDNSILNNDSISFQIGALLETARAAIVADEIAKKVDFLYINTNSLTESTFGFAFEDSYKFIPQLVNNNALDNNPAIWFDKKGVGFLLKIASEKARSSKPSIEIGICGNHVDSPDAIEDYFSLINAVCTDPSHYFDIRLGLAQAQAKYLQGK